MQERGFIEMLKKCGGLVLVLLLIISIFSPGQCFADESWDYKVSLVKHQVEIKINSEIGKFDGADFVTTPPISKNGRIYIPLRLLKDAGLAGIVWNADTHTADLIPADDGYHVRYQAGKAVMYYVNTNEEGESAVDYNNPVTIPAPLVKNGVFYIPVKSLDQVLRKNINYADNILKIYWRVPLIERNSFPEKTEAENQVIKIAYEAGLDIPQVMRVLANGAGGALDDEKGEKIVLDGKDFYFKEVTIPLQPGDNPFYFWARGGNQDQYDSFVVKREVADASLVPVNYNDSMDYMFIDTKIQDVFEITAPASGYAKLAAPGQMGFKGLLKVDSIGDNVFSIWVGKLVKGQYQEYYSEDLPVADGQFGAVLDFKEPGSYVVEVISPKYIPSAESGPCSTKWAEIRVEVADPASDAARGNTSGNLNNGGLYAKAGEWIYFSNLQDDGKLYKMKADGSGAEKISDDRAHYINVIGDDIYYSGNGWNLTKIKTDGTEMSKICSDDARCINVSGDWVYYSDYSGYPIKLYRINIDGTGKEKLSDDKPGYIFVLDDKIFYYDCYSSIMKEIDKPL